MLVFDFEVFKQDWLVVIKDLTTGIYHEIANDLDTLQTFVTSHKNDLWIGYNNSNYDNYIIKGLLMNRDPYYLSHVIINLRDQNRLRSLCDWDSIYLNTYDVSFGLGYTSLKENEGYLGISIVESPIPFDYDDKLDDEQLAQVAYYCRKDVDATEHLFVATKDTFITKLYLCNEFGLDKSYLNKSSQQLIAKVLGAERKFRANDEFDPFDFSQLDLRIKKYQAVIDHFSKPMNYEDKFELMIAKVPHKFGIGGIHGAIPNFSYKGRMLLIDVASYYPSMMIEYDWFARSIPQEKRKLYSKMKADRIVLKKENPTLSDAYKLVLNTTYGCYKFEHGNLYDPRMSNNICVGGMVMLVDLIEQIEPYCILVQSNTDGIIVIPIFEDKVRERVADWERRTRMEMEITVGTRIEQKDVNNYVLVTDNGKIKAVGAYVKQYKPRGLRRTMAVVDKALVEYFVNDTPIRTYVEGNNNPLDYQIISKVGKTYDEVIYVSNGLEMPTNYINRSFAVKGVEGRLYKRKHGKNKELVANHPPNTYLHNDDVENMDMNIIDKDWYIELCLKRLEDYRGGK